MAARALLLARPARRAAVRLLLERTAAASVVALPAASSAAAAGVHRPCIAPVAAASLRHLHAAPSPAQLNTSSIEDVVREVPPRDTASTDAFLASPDVRTAPPGSPLALYAARRAAGLYRRDRRQEVTVRALQGVWEGVRAAVSVGALPGAAGAGGGGGGASVSIPPPPIPRRSGMTLFEAMDESLPPQPRGGGGGGGWLSSLFGGGGGDGEGGAPSPSSPSSFTAAPPGVPRGLYMHGGVGTGKTMLMDLFVEAVGGVAPVRRVHFNDFMLDVHSRLRSASRAPDPLGRVAADLVAAAPVLALDELFVTDVADAAILARLFAGLWGGGLVLVATSNRPPGDLYKGGLQRDLFLPFIASLTDRAPPLDLASPVDYRRLAHAARGLYFCPPDWPTPAAGSAELVARFGEVAAAPGCHGASDGPAPPPAPAAVPVMMGRTLHVPLASGSAALFPFPDLCERALGAADYIALARAYHTLALDGVPAFTAASSAAASRFVTLVDVLYEHRTRTFISAAGTPSALFANVFSRTAAAAARAPTGGGLPEGAWVDDNLAFACERTISRLTEMQTLTYLVAHARAHAPVLLLALEEQQARRAAVPERRN